DCPAQPPFLMPTRRPTISESARSVSSVMRCAAASVSFMTCGRGRGFGLETGAGAAGVMSVMWSIPAANQCPSSSRKPVKFAHDLFGKPVPTFPDHANASPHIEDEAGLVGHPIRCPGRVPHQIDVDDSDAGNAGDGVLDHG